MRAAGAPRARPCQVTTSALARDGPRTRGRPAAAARRPMARRRVGRSVTMAVFSGWLGRLVVEDGAAEDVVCRDGVEGDDLAAMLVDEGFRLGAVGEGDGLIAAH